MRVGFILVLAAAVSALGACKGAPAAPAKEYAYPAWGFAVSFHATPKETATPPSFLVEDLTAAHDEMVNVIDGSGSTKSEDQALSDAPAALATAAHATLGPITYAATGKVMGREFLLNRAGHPATRVRIFVAHQRLYEIVARSERGPDDPEVVGFLDSFRLL